METKTKTCRVLHTRHTSTGATVARPSLTPGAHECKAAARKGGRGRRKKGLGEDRKESREKGGKGAREKAQKEAAGRQARHTPMVLRCDVDLVRQHVLDGLVVPSIPKFQFVSLATWRPRHHAS